MTELIVRDPGRYASSRPAHRLAALLDEGTEKPLSDDDGGAVRIVRGLVSRVPVIAFCTDPAVMAGALTSADADRVVRAIDAAVSDRVPIIGIWHSSGASLAEGVRSMHAFGRVFAAITRASGRVPQISVIVGPAAGGAAYGPALSDVVILAPAGRMFVTGPDVLRRVTGEDVDMERLGGSVAHGRQSGVAHITTASEEEAYGTARHLVQLFARPGIADLTRSQDDRNPQDFLPGESNQAYDVRPLLRSVLDDDNDGQFCEFQPNWAPNMVVGLARICGRSVGVVANNPIRKGGCLDSLSAEKAARFVRLCDVFGIPLLAVTDTPGYLPGLQQEWGGVLRRGAKLLHAFADAVVPRITLVTRKAYGGAYLAMNSCSLGATAVYAWPGAEVAVMGAEAAVDVLYRKELAASADPDRDALRGSLLRQHRETADDIHAAVELGIVDAVIAPQETRHHLAAALSVATPRRGEHRNIPL